MNTNLSNHEKGFIEGFIDTDGHFNFCKQLKKSGRGWTVKTGVGFNNTSKQILEKVTRIFKIPSKRIKIHTKGTERIKTQYIIYIPPRELRILLPQIKLIMKENKRVFILKILNFMDSSSQAVKESKKYQDKLLSYLEEYKTIKYKKKRFNKIKGENYYYKEFTDREIGFLESVIDCDGSIIISKTLVKYLTREYRYKPELSINGRSEIIDHIRRMLGVKNRPIKDKRSSDNYTLRLTSKKAEVVLSKINLVIKEEKRRLALEMLSHFKMGKNKSKSYESKLERIYNQFKEVSINAC
jgi:hypothetical protein